MKYFERLNVIHKLEKKIYENMDSFQSILIHYNTVLKVQFHYRYLPTYILKFLPLLIIATLVANRFNVYWTLSTYTMTHHYKGHISPKVCQASGLSMGRTEPNYGHHHRRPLSQLRRWYP